MIREISGGGESSGGGDRHRPRDEGATAGSIQAEAVRGGSRRKMNSEAHSRLPVREEGRRRDWEGM